MTTRDRIADYAPGALLADGFDDAIIGVAERCGQPTLVAYDRCRCIDILEAQGMSREDAEEYFEFNVAGAWVGEQTPVWIDTRIAD